MFNSSIFKLFNGIVYPANFFFFFLFKYLVKIFVILYLNLVFSIFTYFYQPIHKVISKPTSYININLFQQCKHIIQDIIHNDIQTNHVNYSVTLSEEDFNTFDIFDHQELIKYAETWNLTNIVFHRIAGIESKFSVIDYSNNQY